MVTMFGAAKSWAPAVVIVAVEPDSVALAIENELAPTDTPSTAAVAVPEPTDEPAVNVAVPWAEEFNAVEAPLRVPSVWPPNAKGRPLRTSRLPVSAAPLPWLSLLISAVSVAD